MSTTETDIREGSVRVALGNLLQTEWDASRSLGYVATDDESAEKQIDVTLGTYAEDNAVPQLALRDVSEIADGAAGYAAIKATGEGPIQMFRGRIDALVYVGAQGDLPGGENAQLAAKRIGHEAHSIIHDTTATQGGVMDPATGELLATDLACSRPRVTPDPDLPGPEFVGRCEVTYTLHEDPPNR